jgi:dihydropyrimidinase
MTTKLFINGCVISGKTALQADILVRDSKIAAIGNHLVSDLSDIEIIDCTGCIVMPGAIDAHCHIQLDTGIFATPDNWWIGSQEAARGGITTVIDFVGPQPDEDLRHALDFRLEQARDSIIDYTFHMTALDAKPQTLNAIAQCPSWGISSLKLYTTYRPNYYLDDAALLQILTQAAKSKLTTLIHCENDAIVTAETAKHTHKELWRAYPDMRPAIAESEATERVIRLAEYTGARVVIAHNSCAKTAEAVAQARRRGVAVYNETCPQYLFLNGDDNRHSDEPWRYILQPPLRTLEDNAGLCQAVKSGDVDMIITDHCAYTRQQKENAPTGTPGGLPGLETLLVLTAAIPDMTWCDVARVLAENPARIYGLWPQKGAILPGFDADIVVLKDESYTLDESQLQSFASYSPFHGKQARGRILRVFRRGEEIVREGKTLASKGSGHTVMPHC